MVSTASIALTVARPLFTAQNDRPPGRVISRSLMEVKNTKAIENSGRFVS